MKELPSPRPGYRWEPILAPISSTAAEPGAVEGPDPRPHDAADGRPGVDRRAHPRVATIMRAGTLRSASGREPCLIKDVSPAGALIASHVPHIPGEPVSLRLKGGGEARGLVVRAQDEFIAIRFEREVDLRRLLGDGKRFFTRSRAAMPRVEICRPALLDDGSGAAPVTIVRISQTGARIAGLTQPPGAAVVTLCLPGLAPVEARVARVREDQLDLAFRRKIGFGALAAWLSGRENGGEDAAAVAPRSPFLSAILRPLRLLLPAVALCFLLMTTGSRFSPAEADPVQLPVNESWQPALARVQSVDAAMQVLPTFIARQTGSREERVVNGIDAFVRARFVHGNVMLSVHENWLIRVLSTIFPTVAVPVRPDAILRHDHALCSQQTLVFQELLRRYGIDYASVRMNWPGAPGSNGHFALTAKVDGQWRYYDSDQEIARSGRPLATILDGSGVSAVYRNRPAMVANIAYAAKNGGIHVTDVDAFPAPRGVLLQAGAKWLSSWGWLLLAIASAAAWYRPLLLGKDGWKTAAREQLSPIASLAA